jgi:putative transposase
MEPTKGRPQKSATHFWIIKLDSMIHKKYDNLVNVGYRFRCYPDPDQQVLLARTFGCCRFVYNWALRLRTDNFKAGTTINYNASSAALTALKKTPEHQWLNEVSCVPEQQALRHLQTAYKNFFEKRSSYPTFKRKTGKQAAEYTRSAFKWDAGTRTLILAKIGRLKIRWSRGFTSYPSTVTITKDRAGRYFVTLTLDEQVKKLPKTGEAVGVDLGISRLATLSTGERIHNPKFLRKAEKKLAKAQRILSRREPGSSRRKRTQLRVAKIQAHLADARRDHLNKVTTNLIRRFDVICIEDLNVRGMVRNHSLARSLTDAAFGTFRSMLEYKSTWYGREIKTVDRFFPSSKRCHVCGHIVEALPLSVREWNCPECGAHHDRDENAAINILAAGHAVAVRGGSVRPVRAKARKGETRRTANQLGTGQQQC